MVVVRVRVACLALVVVTELATLVVLARPRLPGERGLLVAVIYVNPLVVGGAQWLVDQELDSLGGRGRSNGLAVVVGGFSQPQVGAHI